MESTSVGDSHIGYDIKDKVAISFLDLFFPKKCVWCAKVGLYICRNCFEKIDFIDAPVCPICQRQAVGGKTHPGCRGKWRLDGLIVGCKYKGPVKVAIKKVKYKWVFDIEKILVDILAQRLWKFDFPQDAILVPIPLHITRRRWRGFNQAEILAITLAKKFGVGYFLLLNRLVDTKTQVGLDKKARIENVKGAFGLSKGADAGGKNIILVDDVYTSGATMAEAASVLKRAGAKSVWGMAVALG